LNSRLKKNSGRRFRLWIGGPQKKIVKIAGSDPGHDPGHVVGKSVLLGVGSSVEDMQRTE
jgi:hypothetical protein